MHHEVSMQALSATLTAMALFVTATLAHADSSTDRQLRELERQCSLMAATGADMTACNLMLQEKRPEARSSDPSAELMMRSMDAQRQQHQELMERSQREADEQARMNQQVMDEWNRQVEAAAVDRSSSQTYGSPTPTYQPSATSTAPQTASTIPTPTARPNRSSSSERSQCLRLSGEAFRGTLSTESTSFINDCNYRIAFTYCVTSANGGGAFSCRDTKFGSDSVAPRGKQGISIMSSGDGSLKIHWLECHKPSDPNGYAYAKATSFDGQKLHGECR